MEQENFDMFNDDPNATALSDKEIEEQINALLNVSDEEIQESLELAAKEEKRVGRKKTATSIKADKPLIEYFAYKIWVCDTNDVETGSWCGWVKIKCEKLSELIRET